VAEELHTEQEQQQHIEQEQQHDKGGTSDGGSSSDDDDDDQGRDAPAADDARRARQQLRWDYAIHVLDAFRTPPDVVDLVLARRPPPSDAEHAPPQPRAVSLLQDVVGVVAAYCSPRSPEQFAMGHVLCALCAMHFVSALPADEPAGKKKKGFLANVKFTASDAVLPLSVVGAFLGVGGGAF
jgi:hypothetical protein